MDPTAFINDVIAREGGFVDNPADPGGATNFGITERVARAHGYTGAMRDLPRATAVKIYNEQYWLKTKFDLIGDIAPHLSGRLLDISVNMGPSTAIGFLRRCLNVLNRSGVSGSNSVPTACIDSSLLSALGALLGARGAEGEQVLIKAINALQGARYIDLAEHRPADRVFVYGWIKNRIG